MCMQQWYGEQLWFEFGQQLFADLIAQFESNAGTEPV